MGKGFRISITAIALLCAAIPATVLADTVNLAQSDTGVTGSLSRGSVASTHAEDGDQQRIAEAKVSGQYQLEWLWQFDVAPGASYRLDLVAQATNSKQGMDHYIVDVSSDGVTWHSLGTVDKTTLTRYAWSFPSGDFSGPVTVRASDDNRSNDSKRSNQLWIDEMVVVSTGAPPTPLGAPSDLSAPNASETVIELAWTDNATGEEGFGIERRISGSGPFSVIATIAADTTSYGDGSVEENKTYDYQVFAFDGTNESDRSNIVTATAEAGGGNNGSTTGPQTDKVIVGYYPSWAIYNARKYWVSYIPFDSVTHVNYAFANVDPGSLTVIVGDTFAEETNRKDPETDNGLPAGNLHQLTHIRDVGHNGPAQEHLKVIISVGGWTWSENFSDAALTPESRWRFAESLKDFVDTFNLDGADLDWEFPTGNLADCGEAGNVCRPEDPLNHALLLMACRLKLDELDPNLELTIAMPVDPAKIAKIMPPMVDNGYLLTQLGGSAEIMRDPVSGARTPLNASDPTAMDLLTRLHIMAYDMAGSSWDPVTRHHAPLYGYDGTPPDPAAGQPLAAFNSHHGARAYQYVNTDYSSFDPDTPTTEFGFPVPADKFTLGVPMYGRGWKSVDGSQSHGAYPGLFQFTDSSTRRRVPKGTWDGGKWGNTGVYAYWDILLNHGGDGSPGSYNLVPVGPPDPARPYGPYVVGNGHFIGFDTQGSLTDKLEYIVDEGLAGVMFWDLAGDLSHAQVVQGIAGAATAHPAEALIPHMASELEALSPSGN